MRITILAPALLILLLILEILVRFTVEIEPDALASSQLYASKRSPVHLEPAASRLTQALSQYTQKPQEVFRIAVVGDTFTFPTAVNFDDTFTMRLERMLQAKARESEKPLVEVLRFGAPHLTALQKVSYARKAAHTDPDLLLVEVDFDDPALEASTTPDTWRHAISLQPGSVLEHWRTLSTVLNALQRKLDESTMVRAQLQLFAQSDTWANFVDSIKLMRQFAAEQDVSLVVVIFPSLVAQPKPEYPYAALHRKIAEQLAGLHIPTIDLLTDYSGIPLSRLRAGQTSEGNEVAQRIAAESLYFRLEKNGFLSRMLTPKQNPGGDSGLSPGSA